MLPAVGSGFRPSSTLTRGVNTPRQSRGLYSVSRSKRLSYEPLASGSVSHLKVALDPTGGGAGPSVCLRQQCVARRADLLQARGSRAPFAALEASRARAAAGYAAWACRVS